LWIICLMSQQGDDVRQRSSNLDYHLAWLISTWSANNTVEKRSSCLKLILGDSWGLMLYDAAVPLWRWLPVVNGSNDSKNCFSIDKLNIEWCWTWMSSFLMVDPVGSAWWNKQTNKQTKKHDDKKGIVNIVIDQSTTWWCEAEGNAMQPTRRNQKERRKDEQTLSEKQWRSTTASEKVPFFTVPLLC
jgi:hypothetical protein